MWIVSDVDALENPPKLTLSRLETHHTSAVPNFSDSAYEFTGVRDAFEGWANNVIPESALTKSELKLHSDLLLTEPSGREKEDSPHVIRRRLDGLPLFPNMNVGSEAPNVVRKVLEGFFSYVWGELLFIMIPYIHPSNNAQIRVLSSRRRRNTMGRYIFSTG